MASSWPAADTVATVRHIFKAQVRWADLDAFGHVNNVVFHAYLQEARVDFLFTHAASVGVDRLATGMVVARQEIDHTAPLGFTPNPVEVHVWVTHVGGSSFTLDYEVKDSSTLYAKARSVLVAYDLVNSSPRRLTDEERTLLNKYLV